MGIIKYGVNSVNIGISVLSNDPFNIVLVEGYGGCNVI